jgi:hypothetical protein
METNMADYCEPTIVQQIIPDADMTPLERLLLSRIFESERIDDGWYFYAEQSPCSMIYATRAELEQALSSSPDPASTVYSCIAELLAATDSKTTEIELDLSIASWEHVFQGIVKRSKTLRYVSVIAAFTCSKMRPDGFGGMATLITGDAILGKSTNDILEDFLSETGLDAPQDSETGHDPAATPASE